jgi:hypothetical protein
LDDLLHADCCAVNHYVRFTGETVQHLGVADRRRQVEVLLRAQMGDVLGLPGGQVVMATSSWDTQMAQSAGSACNQVSLNDPLCASGLTLT